MDTGTREIVRQRAGERYEYCLLPEAVDPYPFHVEHVIARQHGGDDADENLAWACSRCNIFKGTNLSSVDSETGRIVDLYDPRKQTWSDHFDIRDAEIVGLTPTGRATVQLLQMNTARRVDLRRELIEQGIY